MGHIAELQFSRYAREIDLSFQPPIRSSSLLENVRCFLEELVKELKTGGCDFLGHVKIFLESDNGGGYFFSITSSEKPPEQRGHMPETISSAKMTMNAILGGMPEEALETMVRRSLEKTLIPFR